MGCDVGGVHLQFLVGFKGEGGRWGFHFGCCFGILWVFVYFLFSLSRRPFCILPMYLRVPHAFYII
jgi:hypothetical protein